MNKITIITVTYNSAKTLADTINSVNTQTARQYIEYIVIDGQSTDGTLSIIEQNSTSIDKWISEPDQGIYDAMNKGLQMASGQWVGFLHADDLFYDDKVVEHILNAANNNECNLLYGNLNYINGTPEQKVVRFWKSQPFSAKLLKRGWMPPHPTVYMKKDLATIIGAFDTSYRIAADYEYMLRLFMHPQTQSHYINETLINMRLGGVSNRSIGNMIQKSKEDYRALRSNKVGGIYALLVKNLSKLQQFFK